MRITQRKLLDMAGCVHGVVCVTARQLYPLLGSNDLIEGHNGVMSPVLFLSET